MENADVNNTSKATLPVANWAHGPWTWKRAYCWDPFMHFIGRNRWNNVRGGRGWSVLLKRVEPVVASVVTIHPLTKGRGPFSPSPPITAPVYFHVLCIIGFIRRALPTNGAEYIDEPTPAVMPGRCGWGGALPTFDTLEWHAHNPTICHCHHLSSVYAWHRHPFSRTSWPLVNISSLRSQLEILNNLNDCMPRAVAAAAVIIASAPCT